MKWILFGGTGEVGWAVARELLKSDMCSKLKMLGRRTLSIMQDEAKVDIFSVKRHRIVSYRSFQNLNIANLQPVRLYNVN